MMAYTIRRLLGAIPTLFILLVLTFFLLRLAPGGPFDTDHAWPPEIQKNIETKYGLDRPMHVQFYSWIKDILRGDLRESFQYLGKPVKELIAESLPSSMTLGILALLFSVFVGIPLGAVASKRQNTWIDMSAMFMAIAGMSLPSYLVASVLILIFAFWLNWLPPALWEGPMSMILPVITLGTKPMAMIARLTRASLLESLTADYIRTAHAKGLHEDIILYKHALRNSLIPVVALLGPLTANLITGSFVVEIIFQIPGMGKHFVSAVLNRDYPLVMGVTLFYGIILTLCNLVVDLAQAWVDPRIRLQ